jgi:hypothetical protein
MNDQVPGHLAEARRAVTAAGQAHAAHAHAIATNAPDWLLEATHDTARQTTDHAHSIIDTWILHIAASPQPPSPDVKA